MDVLVPNDSTTASYNVTNDVTGLQEMLNGTTTSASKSVVYSAAMFFFGVLGNVTAIIILTIRPSKDSRATAFYHLVKALVFTDLIGIVALSPVTISVYITGGGVINTGGMGLCYFFSFVLIWAGNSTMFLVLVMACERFLVTKFPFKYSQLVKPLTVNCTILGAISVAVLMGVLPILGMGSVRAHWPGTWCFFDFRSHSVGNGILSFFYAIIGLIIVIFTIVLNMTVIRHLWRMRKIRLTSSVRTQSLRSPGEPKPASSGPDSERRMVIFLMAIILVFSICYVPFMVRILMNQLFIEDPESLVSGGVNDVLDLWSLRMASFNQILDPWVYIISRVTCCKGPKNRDDRELQNSMRTSPAANRRSQIYNPQSTTHDASNHQHNGHNLEPSHNNHTTSCNNSSHNNSSRSNQDGPLLSRTWKRVRSKVFGKTSQSSSLSSTARNGGGSECPSVVPLTPPSSVHHQVANSPTDALIA